MPDRVDDPYWGIIPTLAWIATRNEGFVSTIMEKPTRPSSVSNRLALEAAWHKVGLSTSGSSFSDVDTAWRTELCPRLCEGKISGIAERAVLNPRGGTEQLFAGEIFPPSGQLGMAAWYSLDRKRPVLIRNDAVPRAGQPLIEWRHLQFARSSVIRLWPPRDDSERLRVWRNPSDWPVADQYLFLAEAVNTVGERLLTDWALTDPTPDSDPTSEDPGHRRFRLVQATIAAWARTGRLTTATRPLHGGPIRILPRDAWQTEGDILARRFYLCRLDPRAPFEPVTADNPGEYVFIDGGELDQLCGNNGVKRVYLGRVPDAADWIKELSLRPKTRSVPPGVGTAAYGRCRKWLEDEMKGSLDRRPKPKDNFFKEARAKFGAGLSRRRFDILWNEATHNSGATWHRAGRPRKSPR